VNVNIDPMVDAGVAMQPVAYCADEDALINLTDLVTGEDVNGTWTETSIVPSQGNAFNTTNATFKTGSQLPGTYTFEYKMTSSGACPDDSTDVSVIIHPLPIVTINNPGTLDCKNAVLSLDASGSDSGANYTITWSGPGLLTDGNENTLHPTVDKPGNYSLLISNKQTSCSNTASVNVTQNSDTPTSALINSENPACFGDKNGVIQVDQVIGGTPPYVFSLNNAPFTSNTVFGQLAEGSYALAVEDIIGCQWDTMIILEGSSEIIFDAGPDISLEFGDTVLIQAVTNLPQDQIDTVIWAPDDVFNCIDLFCLEGAVNTFSTITLSGTIFDINGCQQTDKLIITVLKNRRIYIPNSFSPNDDGINDVFFISGSERQIRMIKSFAVYNRWGNVMHEAFDFLPNDETSGWDGRYKNQKMNPDVFVYKAIIEYNDGKQEVLSGDITLIK
jgi:gliding motility-associated-like protein